MKLEEDHTATFNVVFGAAKAVRGKLSPKSIAAAKLNKADREKRASLIQRKKTFVTRNKTEIVLDARDDLFMQYFLGIVGVPPSGPGVQSQPFSLYTAQLTRERLKNFLLVRYPPGVAHKVLDFLECPATLDLRLYRKFIE
jgi:hypothetical protein